MSGRMSRDRFRRNHSHQSYHPSSSSSISNSPLSNSSSSRGKNPPSRHLWVGNLDQSVTKSVLADHLVRFGEIESLAYPPGRSYAFVNFMREDDAMAAMDSLQGFSLNGLPLRIEFAKPDKSSAPSHDENYLRHRDELQPSNRGSTSSKREFRTRHASPDAYYPDNSTRTDDSSEQPSEILWVGFPSFLKVDETILRKAFSPFGEIEKITAFPGRTYAFVQFRNVTSACRAKETLQGRLFGNPRVHICFARSDTASSTGGGRRGVVGSNAPPSPHFRHNGRAGSSDNFSADYGNVSRVSGNRPSQYSDLEYRDPEIMAPGRKVPPRMRGNGAYEDRRSRDFEPDVGTLRGVQRSHENSSRDVVGNARFHKFSPENFPRKSPYNDDPWDLPEDTDIYHETKKLKTNPFPEEELPEYPLHILEPSKHVFPTMLPDLPLLNETGSLPYMHPPEHPVNVNRPTEDRHDWRSSHDAFVSPPPSSATPLDWKRTTPELHQPAPKGDLWKWEGTIAKGGTPVCRARCFPVGRVMDIILPEFLDCTARTGLDMLAKHYYQAAGSWVVFFVPASDADMVYYNEFLHYLGDKQRAAVSKLDERHTLFLVPPSDFSEKVLKVPGKLSISGVVLRLEPASPSDAAPPPANETHDTTLMNPYVDIPYLKSEAPSGLLHSMTSYPNLGKPGISGSSFEGNISSSVPSSFPGYVQANQSVSDHIENRHGLQPAHSAWSPHPPPRPALSSRDSKTQGFPVSQEYSNPISGGMSMPYSGRYSGHSGMSYSDGSKLPLPEQKLPSSVPFPSGSLQPRQHPLMGQQGQSFGSSSVSSTAEEYRMSGMIGNQAQQPLQAEVGQGVSHGTVASNRATSDIPSMASGQDEGENDPQKRLQATLQLAAALLQQIQQGKKT